MAQTEHIQHHTHQDKPVCPVPTITDTFWPQRPGRFAPGTFHPALRDEIYPGIRYPASVDCTMNVAVVASTKGAAALKI